MQPVDAAQGQEKTTKCWSTCYPIIATLKTMPVLGSQVNAIPIGFLLYATLGNKFRTSCACKDSIRVKKEKKKKH